MIYYITDQKFVEQPFCKMGSKEAFHNWIKDKKEVGLDTETSGLNFLEDKLLLVIIGDKDTQFIINAVSTDLDFIKPYLESREILKVLHTAHFDYKFLRSAGIVMENIWDINLVEQVLTKGMNIHSYSLKAMVGYYFKVQMGKEIRQSFVGHTESIFSFDQILYAAADVKYLLGIRQMQMPKLSKKKLWNVAHLENHSTLAFADIEYNGFHLNKQAWEDLYEEALLKSKEIERELDKIILSDNRFMRFRTGYQLDAFLPEEEIRKISINWESPKQVLLVLQTMNPNIKGTGVEDIEDYAREPLIKLLLEYKQYKKRTGAFGIKFFDLLYSDGKIHTEFTRILNTGRVSSSNPNMQQIPADNRYRNCFDAGEEGWVLVSADYSSQELALIAWDSQDPVWLNALQNGEDLHSVCAELVYKDKWKEAAEDDCAYYQEIEKEEEQNGTMVLTKTIAKAKCKCPGHKKLRTNVKTINFGLAYGGGPGMLSTRLGISEEAATNLIEEYFKAFPTIHNYLESRAEYGLSHGFIRTMAPFGRIRYFKEWGNTMDESEMGQISRQSKNTRIQGSGADMTKYALTLIRKEININKLPVKLIMQIHDEIVTAVRKDYAMEWSAKLEYLMNKAAKVIVKNGLLKAVANSKAVWEK